MQKEGWQAFSTKAGWLKVMENMGDWMVYGLYPGIVNLENWQKQKKVTELASDYLFKDLLTFDQVKDSSGIRKLLRALAFQVGSQVSVNEISNLTGLSRPLVDKYLDLLQKCFIIFRLQSYSSNLRNEIMKSSKFYFYDNGILNALTGNFNPLQNRNDVGVLWENLVISEFVKHYNNMDIAVNFYFWRTYDWAEIDLIIEENQELTAFEIKWSPKKKVNLPESFKAKYGVETLTTINPQSLHLVFEAE